MGITDIGAQYVAYIIGGSQIGSFSYFMIGSGSGAFAVTNTTLVSPTDRQLVTNTDISSAKKITWQGDWNSVEMSGLTLTEYGITQSGAGVTGSMMSMVNFVGINFDGTNELQTKETWEFFNS